MEVTPVVFVTHNKGKVVSANKYFEGVVKFEAFDYEINEIRGSLDEIAIAKVKAAYELTGGQPTLSMDAGFFVDCLNGFPGSYVNHCMETIGIDGILKLMVDIPIEERTCSFRQSLAYYDGLGEPKLFHGIHKGIVACDKYGVLSEDDWSELSYIFIPIGNGKTLAEMTHEERMELSKKDKSESAFKVFRDWYLAQMNSQY